MKRVLWFVPVILLLCVPARAQTSEDTVLKQETRTLAPAPSAPKKTQKTGPEVPEWEIFGGYSYLRANFSGPGSAFSMNGGTGSLTENLNNWFGGRFEFNAWGGKLAGTNVTAQSYTYGPVFSLRRLGRSTMFVTPQFGAMHVSGGYLNVSQSDSKFAMIGEGGMDFRVNKMTAIRFEGGYLMSNFLNTRQDNIVASAGIVFYFGRARWAH